MFLHVVAFFAIIGLAYVLLRASEFAAESYNDKKLLLRPKVVIPEYDVMSYKDERQTIYLETPKRHSLN